MKQMERDEPTKMESIDAIPDPQGVSIDANEQMNRGLFIFI